MSRKKRAVALAGGGPLGGIYEIGCLVALDEALIGLDFIDCDVYVGVSSGGFISAGLANGISPRSMHEMFIESEEADDPFEPEILLRPALLEYMRRFASLPGLVMDAAKRWLSAPLTHGFFESFSDVSNSLPTGLLDNRGVGEFMGQLFSAPGRTNDFRHLKKALRLVAMDLDTAESVAFGGKGWDHVPISRAVQASAALPGLFPPVEIGGRHYVDGALVRTIHASVALKEGVKLLVCINPLVPFNATAAANHGHLNVRPIVEGGLPMVLSQTFRSLIHSRMQVGMGRYKHEYPDADIVLFEAAQHDPVMFFTNVFSYADRRRLAEHAYQQTRTDLRKRTRELEPVLARHGISIDHEALNDPKRTLERRNYAAKPPRGLKRTARQLERTLYHVEGLLKEMGRRR
jgi:NTE family protein